MNTGTVLDDQRIADLRGRVMADVDADVRRRSRRARLVAGTAAAGVVAIGLVAGTAALTTEPSPSSGYSGAADIDTMPAPAPVPADGYDLATPQDQSEIAPVDPSGTTDRSVVTTGTAALVVGDPSDAATDFGAWVEDRGGRIDQRSDRSGRTDLTVRIPADDVNAAVEELRDLGELESSSIDRADVTAQVVDLDARIGALQASIARLTDILNRATTTADVVEAESNLTQRQAELDGLVAQRTALGDEVALSTITVSFSETPTTASVEPDGFLGGLRTGWNSVVETLNGVVHAAGVAAPWLGILAVLLGGAWAVTRRRRKA